jgi:hypothetical protein
MNRNQGCHKRGLRKGLNLNEEGSHQKVEHHTESTDARTAIRYFIREARTSKGKYESRSPNR